jgi:dTDP-4-amino-4,6-dideoxygalactose transaminase
MIPFHKIEINEFAKKNVEKVIKSGWLTSGSYVEELEKWYKEKTKAKYAIAVNSATAGLSLCLKSLNLPKKSEIFVPTYTFISTVNTIEMNNLVPNFIDCEMDNPNTNMLSYINNNRILVSIGGQNICNPPLGIGNRATIKDLAHMNPMRYIDNGFGADVYSLYATKPLTAGEGGIIVTSNKEIYERIISMRWHGIKNTSLMRRNSIDDEYDVETVGYKFNMSDLHASIALGQVETELDDLEKRKYISNFYEEQFKNIEEISYLIKPSLKENHSHHLAMIIVKKKDVKKFRKDLMIKGVGTSKHFRPVHTFSYYAEKYKIPYNKYPNSVSIYEKEVSLPIYPSLRKRELKYIIKSIKDVLHDRK